jgi:ribosomal protein S18 acetylase RimI-like enzyme
MTDEAKVLAVLERDRAWGAYAITDLDPPHDRYARFLGEKSEDAVVLVYSPPGFTSIIPHGEAIGTRKIIEHAKDLPEQSFVLARPQDLPALEASYLVDDIWTMYRMAMDVSQFRAARTGHSARELTEEDLPALQRLYSLGGESIFQETMLLHGLYVGLFDGDAMVAAAGTHTLSPKRGIATIGGVFTHPEHRGKGFGTAITSAVVSAAVDRGIDFLALNVKTDNEPARRAYRRLGFTERVEYWEGNVVRR